MTKKKMISILLVIVSLLSFCSFSVYADEGLSINTIDMDWHVTYRVPTQEISEDITDEVSVSVDTSQGVFGGFTCFRIPNKYYKTFGSFRLLFLSSPFTLRADHEYNIKFSYGHIFSLPLNCSASLVVYTSSGELYKSIPIYSGSTSSQNKAITPDFNFLVKSADLPDGYVCRLSVSFEEINNANTTADGRICISPQIEVSDLDDDSGWFEKILNAIKAIPQNIASFFQNLGNSIGGFFENLWNNIKQKFDDLKTWIDGLGENIKQWFIDLGNDISEFFTMLKNYLLYFQHPVTVNADGVLIGKDGKPVYTNPFDSAIDKVKTTVDDWLSKINDFVDGMEQSRLDVTGYLESGTGVINKVLKASPILTACVVFAVGFLVIRKVVGR